MNNTVDNLLIEACSKLRTSLLMKYIKIIADEENIETTEFNEVLNGFKVELCDFHSKVSIIEYKDSEKEFRDNTIVVIELFIDIVETRINQAHENIREKEKALYNRFNLLRKMSNSLIREKNINNE